MCGGAREERSLSVPDKVTAILARMQVPHHEGLYVLSCFERPARFYMQRIRALNLIYALSRIGQSEAQTLAVVGAGAAGITAAAAAAMHRWPGRARRNRLCSSRGEETFPSNRLRFDQLPPESVGSPPQKVLRLIGVDTTDLGAPSHIQFQRNDGKVRADAPMAEAWWNPRIGNSNHLKRKAHTRSSISSAAGPSSWHARPTSSKRRTAAPERQPPQSRWCAPALLQDRIRCTFLWTARSAAWHLARSARKV